jgi:hypothetical protein
VRAYTFAVIFVCACHVYFSISAEESPLTILFFLVMLSPFLPIVWKEISNIKLDKDGISLEKLKIDVDRTIKRAAHQKSIDPNALDDLFKTVELN